MRTVDFSIINDLYKKEEFHKILINDLGESRYNHTIRVAETAARLADRYNYSKEKAKAAGLLHDCAKFKDPQRILKNAEDFGIILDDYSRNNPGLVHASLGAEIARIVYGVKDEEVLNAIRYHTVGKPNMTMLEKIIYLADYIEPQRSFPGVNEIRRMAMDDLDKALLLAMENTIKYVIENGFILHEDTVKARNYLVFQLKVTRNGK